MQASGKHCDNVAAGPHVGAVSIGFPVTEQVAPTLRYWVRQYVAEAKFEKDLKKHAPKTQCMVEEFDPEAQTGTPPGVFAGPFAILFLAVVLATGWAVWAKYRRNQWKKAAAKLKVVLQEHGYVPCDSADQIQIGIKVHHEVKGKGVVLDIIQNEKRGRPFVVRFNDLHESTSARRSNGSIVEASDSAAVRVEADSAALQRAAISLYDLASGVVVLYSLAQMKTKFLIRPCSGPGPGWGPCSDIKDIQISVGTCLHHDKHGARIIEQTNPTSIALSNQVFPWKKIEVVGRSGSCGGHLQARQCQASQNYGKARQRQGSGKARQRQ